MQFLTITSLNETRIQSESFGHGKTFIRKPSTKRSILKPVFEVGVGCESELRPEFIGSYKKKV